MAEPTVGRIVHYNPEEAPTDKKQPYPAAITHVWTPTCVNLRVLNDFSFPMLDVVTTSVVQGDGPGQWNWPVREGI